MKKLFACIALLAICHSGLYAQNVAINNDGSAPDPAAILDIKSVTKGLLIPRMTQAQRLSINPVSQGLMVYQTDNPSPGFYYNASANPLVANWLQLGNDQFWKSGTGSNIQNANTGNVGINISNPQYPFTVAVDGTGVAQQNTTGTVRVGLFTNANHAYLQTITNSALRFATNNKPTQMMLDTTGALGIGTTSAEDAGLVVDKKVNGAHAIFGRYTTGVSIESSSPGIAFNSYANAGRKALATGYTGLLNLNPTNGSLVLFNSNVSSFAGGPTTAIPRFLIDKNGNIGVQGNLSPITPLSFASSFGNKINVSGSSPTAHYGMGVQASLLQLYSNEETSDIAFGYGSSTNFTENLRIKGDGKVGIGNANPAYRLDVSGRVRLRYSGSTAGIWLNKQDNSDEAVFAGNMNDTMYGLYNSSKGWQFAFDHKNARLGIDIDNPKVALSFRNIMGKKISLYPGASGEVGMGVFPNEFRLHSDAVSADITFGHDNYINGFTERMRVKGDGRVCIGTSTPAAGYMLSVNGKIIANEVRVQLKANWPDYVFNKDYDRMSLEDLETYVKAHKRLPGFEPASVVEKEGADVGEVQRRLLEKVEELTLHLIDVNHRLLEMNKNIEALQVENTQLKNKTLKP